jgi:hypothetical protein
MNKRFQAADVTSGQIAQTVNGPIELHSEELDVVAGGVTLTPDVSQPPNYLIN